MTETALVPYHDREEIKELADRIETMLPGPNGQALPHGTRLALAQVAVTLGLNPFTGELWAIPQGGGGYSLMTGIKGLRRAARNTAPYTVEFRNMDSDEREEWGLKPGEIGKVCMLYRLTDADKELSLILGHYPVIYGYGVCRQGEKTKMAHPLVANKRAESDALKIGFDLPTGMKIADDEFDDRDRALPVEYSRGSSKLFKTSGEEATGAHALDDIFDDRLPPEDEIVDAEVVDVTEEPQPEPETVQANGNSVVIFSAETLQNAHEYFAMKINNRTGAANNAPASHPQEGLVAGLLNEALGKSDDIDIDRHAWMEAMVGKPSVKELTAGEAHVLLDFLGKTGPENSKGKPTTVLTDNARTKVPQIMRALRLTQGAQDMFNPDDPRPNAEQAKVRELLPEDIDAMEERETQQDLLAGLHG